MNTPPLTDNQAILLKAIVTAYGPTTLDLSGVLKANGDVFGPDAARNALKRMEDRNLILGTGGGTARSWAATSAGRELALELGFGSGDEDESPVRRYVVLEELQVSQLVARLGVELTPEQVDALKERQVYVQVALPEARNTEHAYRQTAKSVFADADSEPTLVAVATKMWRPTPVRIQTRQTVSVG